MIHIVVQNVGLEDEGGRAHGVCGCSRRTTRTLQRLLKEGSLPPLLAIIARDAARVDGRWEDGSASAGAGPAVRRLVERTKPPPPPAAAVEAFSSSGPLAHHGSASRRRGRGAQRFQLCRARGEFGSTPGGARRRRKSRGSRAPAQLRAGKGARASAGGVRAGAGAYFREQPRVGAGSGPVRDIAAEDSLDDPDPSDGMDPGDAEKRDASPRAAATASTARSLLCLLESDAVVAHRAAAAGLAVASSGRAGRIATARCGAVLPLMTAALAGNAAQRAAALAALDAISSRGVATGPRAFPVRIEKSARTDPGATRRWATRTTWRWTTWRWTITAACRAPRMGRARRKTREAAALEAVNAKANARGGEGWRDRHGGEGWRGVFRALDRGFSGFDTVAGAFTPRRRGRVTRVVGAGVATLQPAKHERRRSHSAARRAVRAEGERAGAAGAAAADDAGAVLGVLARLCERSRESIEFVDPTPGKRLVRHLLDGKDPESPGSNSGSNSGGGGGAAARKLGFSREAFFSAERGTRKGREKDPGDRATRTSFRTRRRPQTSGGPSRGSTSPPPSRARRRTSETLGEQGDHFYITTHENVQRPIIKMTVLASRVECQVFGAPRRLILQRAPRGRADAGGVSPETVPAFVTALQGSPATASGLRAEVGAIACDAARLGALAPARTFGSAAGRVPRATRGDPRALLAPFRRHLCVSAPAAAWKRTPEGYVRVPRDAEAKTARRNRGGARAAARSGTSEEGPSSMNAARESPRRTATTPKRKRNPSTRKAWEAERSSRCWRSARTSATRARPCCSSRTRSG